MFSIVLQRVLIDGLLLSVLLGVLVMSSLKYNARLWLQDYPKEVQAKVPPISKQEKMQQRILMLPFLLLTLGIPYLSVTIAKASFGGVISFPQAYLVVTGVLQVFNLFDAVVLDYLILTVIKPRFALIPGTTWEEYSMADMRFQLRNFVKGIVICAVISLPIALVGSL
ncbi:MAG: hypothetical protein GC179_17640 [Anaerolineaceae bacterium]|nr:hypothetical protein [Anaerolineaceae bacterium]